MTGLNKIVRRRANRIHQNLHNRRIIVMLEPGDTIAMRLERRRKVVRASIDKIYWIMAKWDAAEILKKKAIEKKLRKANKCNICTNW